MAGIRDAMLHEAQGIVGAMVSLDQSYEVVPPLGVGVDSILPVGSGYTSSASYSAFRDSATWANGRLTPSELVNVAQTVYVSNNLGSVMPLP
jgi:pantoate kinase